MTLPVLMYHGVHAERGSRGVFDAYYSVTPDALAAQLDRLVAGGWTTVHVRDPIGGPGAPEKPVALTFDDGDVSFLEVAAPMLRERGMVADFFVTSDYVGRPGMLDPAGVRALVDAGMGVESHARTHRALSGLSVDELDEELRTSRERLTAWSGREVVALSLPGGHGAERERVAALRLGYTHLLHSVPGPNRSPRPQHYLQRTVITRGTGIEEFDRLVAWRGLAARRARGRVVALSVPKRVLGKQRYDTVRSRLRRR